MQQYPDHSRKKILFIPILRCLPYDNTERYILLCHLKYLHINNKENKNKTIMWSSIILQTKSTIKKTFPNKIWLYVGVYNIYMYKKLLHSFTHILAYMNVKKCFTQGIDIMFIIPVKHFYFFNLVMDGILFFGFYFYVCSLCRFSFESLWKCIDFDFGMEKKVRWFYF